MLKKDIENKILQFENEYVGDGDDMNDNDVISEYMQEFDDKFIELRRKYGIGIPGIGIGINEKHNNERKELIVKNKDLINYYSNSNSFLIGIICLQFSLFGIIIYQCFIIDKYTKDSKYINIA